MTCERRRRREPSADQSARSPVEVSGPLTILSGNRPPGLWLWLGLSMLAWHLASGSEAGSPSAVANSRIFAAQGVVKGLDPASRTVRIAHEAISNYMAAMTMPFKVKELEPFKTLEVGDRISFRLHVTEEESWIDGISKVGAAVAENGEPKRATPPTDAQPASEVHPLLLYHFTNELGQAVSLADFRGQALAITFFFTRCPIPDFCPRLSKNFEEASAKLKAMTNAPANWHLLSVTFDPAFDTPAVLRAYAQRYHYDPAHWSFITGPQDKIAELARSSDVQFTPDSGLLNHNFRTLIIDATGHLQMVFPTGGNLSEAIVSEIVKAATATNRPS
jgi:protein SCO1/2